MKITMHLKDNLLHLLLLTSALALPDPAPTPEAAAIPDLSASSSTPDLDPEDPDFSGVVDFSDAVPGPDGSWCITKVKYVDHMENDQVKECWHQNVTQCHDTYITEFLPSQEQKCEESFWKSCKIDFKEMPFNYTLKQCHTPLIKQCDDLNTEYGSPAKTVCRTWFESECNTTYVETKNGAHKPNTWCQKMPRKICAPDNCNMVKGPEDCRDKTMVSTIQKPEEHCELQPQRHCRLITKLVPHLTTKEVCKAIPKEICVLQLVNPHPVKKPIQLKWCTKKKDEIPQKYQSAQQPEYNQPQAPPTSYLPASQGSPFQTQPPPSYDTFSRPIRREDNGPEENFPDFEQLRLPPTGNEISSGQNQQFQQFSRQSQPANLRPVRRTFESMKPMVSQRKRHIDHMSQKEIEMYFTGSQPKVHVVQPQPGGNNAHRVKQSIDDEENSLGAHIELKKTSPSIKDDMTKTVSGDLTSTTVSTTTHSHSSSLSASGKRKPRAHLGSSLRNHPSSIF
jgi:hypothetical protein